jgi:YD repeat-containing protein
MTRSAGGTISRIDTYREGSGFDSVLGRFSGTPARTQAFEYDGNARLTRETVTQAAEMLDTVYEYDFVGNRTKKTLTSPAGVEVTRYSYDLADRLTLQEVSLPAGGSRTTSHAWDANGNLASRTEPGLVTL